jgi:hypothetical protein
MQQGRIYVKPPMDYADYCIKEAEQCIMEAELNIALATLLIKESHRYDKEVLVNEL